MTASSLGGLSKDVQSQGYNLEQKSDENGHHLKLTVPVEGVGNVLVHATVDKNAGQERVEQLKTTLVQSVQKTVSQSKQIEMDVNQGQFASKLGHEVQQSKQSTSVTTALEALHIANVEVQKELVLTQDQIDVITYAVEYGKINVLRSTLTPEKVVAYEKQTQSSLAAKAIMNVHRDKNLHLEMLKCVLDNKASANAPDNVSGYIFYPIFYAVNMKNLELLKLLIERGADPNLRDAVGNTVLHLAAGHDDPTIIKSLLDAGADPDLINSNHYTAYFIAVQGMRQALKKFFLRAGTANCH